MQNPLVTIILPTHNGACHIVAALESCCAQTAKNWEVIVVDDASTDRTPEIVAEFVAKDPRIRSKRHEVNRKLPAALNTGFRMASGDYLTWTSDDNVYEPRAIERMLGYLEEHPETGFVYAGMALINEAGNRVGTWKTHAISRLPLQNVVGACFLYRRTVAERIGVYAEHLLGAEDYDYWIRVHGQFRMDVLHESLYRYRLGPHTMTTLLSRQVLRNTIRAIRGNFRSFAGSGQRARAWLHLSGLLRRLGWRTAACRTSCASLAACPPVFLRHALLGPILDVLRSNLPDRDHLASSS